MGDHAKTAAATRDVDVLVLGWGKGGTTLAAALAAEGTRVAMVEQFQAMHGGTCINIGCVPTKTLIHDAQQRREQDDPAQFWSRAVARRDAVVGAMREVNHAMLADLDAVTLIDGRARFVGPRTVEVRGGLQQTSLSLDDHRIVLSPLHGDGSRSTADRVAVPTTLFLSPPLASVGLTEAEARAEGREVLVARQEVARIKAMPRPEAVADPRGLVTFVVDAHTEQILGARLFHVDAQEVINLVALAMRTGTTATRLKDGIWTHPSSTEALDETLGKLAVSRP